MKINISDTSLLAYDKNKETFANRSDQAEWYLRTFGPKTSNELFDLMKHTFPSNYRHNTHARLADLRDEGRVYVANKRECDITKETVSVWNIVPYGLIQEYKISALKEKLKRAKLLVLGIEEEIMLLENTAPSTN